nr:putative zinc finger, CCHC-type [Tanacetum cinerariifolium]
MKTFTCPTGHFARNCSDKKRSQALIHALNQIEPVDVSDLESLYTLVDELSDSVLCTITYSDLLFDDDSNTNSMECDSDFGVHVINPIPHVLPIQEGPPLPLAKIHLLTDAYAKPIPVITFLDTVGIATSHKPILKPYPSPCYPNLLRNEIRQSHAKLLSKFYSLVTKYGIVLSKKKMEVGVTTIQFLSMEISDGKYLDELSSQKMIQQFLRWLTTTRKGTYVLVMFRRQGSFLPPKFVNDDGSIVYHTPYCFIRNWYKVNPSSRRCERKLQTLYTDTSSLIARVNGVDPYKIPYHLYDNLDHYEVETSDDDDDARSLWSSDDNEHFDPFEDNPTRPDAR